ncbi:MAG TPA: hypothetical protein VH589_08490 [Trebonia sp.]
MTGARPPSKPPSAAPWATALVTSSPRAGWPVPSNIGQSSGSSHTRLDMAAR